VRALENKGRMDIDVRTEGEYVKVMIRDYGCGIPSHIIDNIFEPFFTTKEEGEGSGLGLDIVKNIIDKHNGTIDVESIEGEGATFTVLLPIKTNHDPT
jgi:signal transduction histidine kinase